MKYIATLILVLGISLLAALPNYYPLTSIAEDFCATWCGGCQLAFAGLDVVHANTHHGEFVSARLYTESADLSSPSVDDRFSHYEVIGIPAVIFNGKTRIDGSNDQTSNGGAYYNALRPYLHGTSPVKINIASFNSATGVIYGTVEMLSPTLSLVDDDLYLYLVEDELSFQDTHVTRQVINQTISLSGAGSTYDFAATFSINPAWNQANLWAAAFIQRPDNAILQTAHTLPLPTYQVRAAFDWDNYIVSEPSVQNYNSQPFWIFNPGASDNFTTRIEVEEAPADWYFNYCDEDGNCYPGNTPIPITLASGEAKEFHLNLWIGSSGLAKFRFVVNSPNLGDYEVPFRFRTSDLVSGDDPLSPQLNFSLGSNYPNPFRSLTTISVNATKAIDAATVDIYNLKGQKVDSVVLRALTPGANTIQWSPSSDLPSGIYFQKLRGSYAPAGRMLLSK